MALAKPFNRAVTKTVEVTEQVPHVELNLSMEEATALRMVLACANAQNTHRGRLLAGITAALRQAGVPWDFEPEGPYKSYSGSFKFNS